jgi:riboflavin kinase/FMN adenylyltransferase
MHVLHGLDALANLPRHNALSVGNFDGVHLGHRKIIERLQAADAAASVVITFEPHPMTVLRPDRVPPRLTSVEHKRKLLADAGVSHLVELPADASVLELSDRQFWETICDQAQPVLWVEGDDFRFGKGATGNVQKLQQWAAEVEVDVEVIDAADVTLPGLQVVQARSGLARWLLAHGRVQEAATVLGRPYEVVGTVVNGEQRGRTIGFPTANLEVTDQLIPLDGVYAASTTVAGTTHRVALSIGTNPTFDGPTRTVEAFLLDFTGDLYGQTLTVRLHRWLRGQEKYDGIDALVHQLHRDVVETRRVA